MDHPIARLALIGMTLLLGLFYVLQINITATKGYDIRELEQQITQLNQQANELDLQALELQSIDRMRAQLPNYKLVDAKPDAYYNTGLTAVASR